MKNGQDNMAIVQALSKVLSDSPSYDFVVTMNDNLDYYTVLLDFPEDQAGSHTLIRVTHDLQKVEVLGGR
jgi:hypothetical protein